MKSVILLFALSISGLVYSQTISTICDSLDNYWNDFFNQYGPYVTYMESAPELLTSIDSLSVHLKGGDSLFNKKDTIKVFTKFYVSEDGNPFCIKIINKVNSELKTISIRKVERLKFKPAIAGKKIIIVPYTLPIIFIKDST